MFRRFASLLRSGLKRVSDGLSFLHENPPPEEATSLIITLRSDRKFVFLGSCFAYSFPHVFLTAAHCIRDSASSTLRVACATKDTPDKSLLVRQVITHPTADLAVLIADPSDPDFTPYREVLEVEPGDEVHAYGFHEDTTNHGIEPLDRHFHGVAQRLFTWDVQKPYSYDAIELSFGAPPGLSGGPLYKSFLLERSGTHYFLVGMVTSNREASIHLETTTEVQEGSQYYIERIHSVTNFGIALNLAPYTEWLTKTCKGVVET
jgi:S1-C subfamily serine protease